MKIAKIINNNIVCAYDENGGELVLMGRGLGYGVKSGAAVDESKIEKVFKPDKEGDADRWTRLLSEIPEEHISTVALIIKEAAPMIDKQLGKSIYFSLSDHVSFAIERHLNGMDLTNPLEWDVKHFYKQEYAAGLKALEIIHKQLMIDLPKSEAASIALHFVNAELGMEMNETVDITKLMQTANVIVKYEFKRDLDEDSIDYERFITHLKFFAQRVLQGKTHKDADTELYDMIKECYPKHFACAQKIARYVEKSMGFEVSDDEKVFLAVHIRRITG